MNRIIFFILATTFILVPHIALAEVQTFTKEYTYQASELDSKVTSRLNAMEQVKRLILEELGVLVISKTVVENSVLTKDQIISYTGGIVSTVVLDEKWSGQEYWVKAKVVADPDAVSKTLQMIKDDTKKTKDLEDARQKIAQLSLQMEILKKGGGGGTQQERQNRYNKIVSHMSAYDWFMKAFATYDKSKPYSENLESIEALNKAIETDPEFSMAYFLRSAFKLEYTKEINGAIDDISKAIATFNPDSQDFADLFQSKAPLFATRAKYNYMAKKYKETVSDLLVHPQNLWVTTGSGSFPSV